MGADSQTLMELCSCRILDVSYRESLWPNKNWAKVIFSYIYFWECCTGGTVSSLPNTVWKAIMMCRFSGVWSHEACEGRLSKELKLYICRVLEKIIDKLLSIVTPKFLRHWALCFLHVSCWMSDLSKCSLWMALQPWLYNLVWKL